MFISLRIQALKCIGTKVLKYTITNLNTFDKLTGAFLASFRVHVLNWNEDTYNLNNYQYYYFNTSTVL